MDIQIESSGDRRIIRIKEKVTFEHCELFHNQVKPALDDSVREVVIDFKDVPFMDSSGIGEILRIFRVMQDRKGQLTLINPNHKLRDLFNMYRFEQYMKILDRVEAGQE
jgi:anti-sigma B factor antagonist